MDPELTPGQQRVLSEIRNVQKKALIAIDVQIDFCEGGALAVNDGSAVVPVVNALREQCRWDAIFLTQDWHPPTHASFASNNGNAELFSVRELPGMGKQVMWPDHCVQGTPGAEFHPKLLRAAADTVVRKGSCERVDSYSGFGDGTKGHTLEKTQLEEELRRRGTTDIFLAGLALDYCVAYTAKDAAQLGFNVFVVEDGCRGIGEASIAAEKDAMRALGVRFITAADVPTAAQERSAAARRILAGARLKRALTSPTAKVLAIGAAVAAAAYLGWRAVGRRRGV